MIRPHRLAPIGQPGARSATRRSGPRWAALVLLVAALWSVTLATASPANAHAVLESANPTDGERLTELPERVELTFSEPVGLSSGYLRVVDQDGDRVDAGDARSDGATISVGLRGGLPEGSFLISYRLLSADSHPIGGALAFVAGEGPLVAASPDAGAAGEDPVVRAAVSVLRWLSYAGLCLLAGPLLLVVFCWPAAFRTSRVRQLFDIGAGVSVLTAAISLLVQSLYVSGAGLLDLSALNLPATLGSTYGVAVGARLILVVVLAVVVARLVARRVPPGHGPVLAAVGVFIAIALTFPLAGHPIASSLPPVSVVADLVHVLAMAGWLGGLAVLAATLLRDNNSDGSSEKADGSPVLAEVLPRFSTLAFASVVALALTGTIQAVLEISPLAALWSTPYGLLVTFKAIGLAVLVVLGNVARTWVRRRYDPQPVVVDEDSTGEVLVEAPPETSVSTLRRSLLVEIGVAAAVLVLASILTTTAPARSTYAAPYEGSLALSDGGSVELSVAPARPGPNVVHLYLFDSEGQPVEPLEVFASASLFAQQLGPLDLDLTISGPGHYTATAASFPVPGDWQLTISVRTGEFDASTVTAEVPVR